MHKFSERNAHVVLSILYDFDFISHWTLDESRLSTFELLCSLLLILNGVHTSVRMQIIHRKTFVGRSLQINAPFRVAELDVFTALWSEWMTWTWIPFVGSLVVDLVIGIREVSQAVGTFPGVASVHT